MAIAFDPKDPEEVKDYSFNWSAQLEEAETIETSTWTVTEGTVTISASPAPSIDGPRTRVWLEDGTAGEICLLTNHVETSGGRVLEQSCSLRVYHK